MSTYKTFLELCACEANEENLELLRRACERRKLSESELVLACERLPKLYHLELVSIRKLLGLYVREWLELEALRDTDELKIYYNVPGPVSGLLWLQQAAEKNGYKTYLGSPDLINMIVLYGIIMRQDKLECRSCRHCAVNIMRRILTQDGLIPPPDIRWTNGLVCDEAPAMDMLIKEYEENTLNVRLVKAAKYGDQCHYMLDELEEALGQIKKRYGFEPNSQSYSDIKLGRFLLAVNIENIRQFLNREKKFYIGNADMTLIETLLLTNFNGGTEEVLKLTTEIFEEMLAIKNNEELRENLRDIELRFTVYYTPSCNPEYSKHFEVNGIALLFPTALKSKAIFATDADPREDIVFECLEMLIGKSAEEEADEIIRLIKGNNLDGMVLGMFTFDRWMGAHQSILKRRIEAETNKPVFIYETDFWNQESWNDDRLITAIETLKYAH